MAWSLLFCLQILNQKVTGLQYTEIHWPKQSTTKSQKKQSGQLRFNNKDFVLSCQQIHVIKYCGLNVFNNVVYCALFWSDQPFSGWLFTGLPTRANFLALTFLHLSNSYCLMPKNLNYPINTLRLKIKICQCKTWEYYLRSETSLTISLWKLFKTHTHTQRER